MRSSSRQKRQTKQGSALLYVLLLLSLILILGASLVSLAGLSGKQTTTEMAYQQAYFSAKSGLELILQEFSSASEDSMKEQQLRTMAINTAVNQTQPVAVTLPSSAKMGELSAVMTCLERDEDYKACSLFKIAVTATVQGKTRTVSANAKATFISGLAEVKTPILTMQDPEEFMEDKDDSVTILDQDGNALEAVEDIVTQIEGKGINDKQELTQEAWQAFVKMVDDLYSLSEKRDSLPLCKSNGEFNRSCLFEQIHDDEKNKYWFENDSENLFMLMQFKSHQNSYQFNDFEFITFGEKGYVYTVILDDPVESKDNDLEIDFSHTIFQDFDKDKAGTFLFIYLGNRDLELEFSNGNDALSKRADFKGWIIAPNAEVKIENDDYREGYYLQGGIIAKEVELEDQCSIQYEEPSDTVKALVGAIMGGTTESFTMKWWAVYD